MRVFASALLMFSPAFAYLVNSPGGNQGWTTTGPNYMTWSRVDTDPKSFAAVLTNMNSPYERILNPYVDGTLGKVVCNPPYDGWPVGSGYRVNIAQDAQHPNSLLAQSGEFTITKD